MSPQNLTLPQNKLEVAVENNAANNNSTGSVASTKKNKECGEKTSDAQVSCHPISNFIKIVCCSMILRCVDFLNFSTLDVKRQLTSNRASLLFIYFLNGFPTFKSPRIQTFMY